MCHKSVAGKARDAAVLDALLGVAGCFPSARLCISWKVSIGLDSRVSLPDSPAASRANTCQLKSSSCERVSGCVWLGSCVHRFSTHSFSLSRMRGLHEPAAYMHECPRINACVTAGGSDSNRQLGLVQTCEYATKGQSCLNVAEPFPFHCLLDESRGFNDTSSAIPKTMLFPRHSFLSVCHSIARILVPRAPAMPQNPCNAMTSEPAIRRR
jgi:hypothetical protein